MGARSPVKGFSRRRPRQGPVGEVLSPGGGGRRRRVVKGGEKEK